MNLVGTMLANYRIDRLLGEGGMGTVYQAYDVSLQRDVAIKLIHPHLASQPSFVDRFVQEARMMARLDHPGIVRVFALGRLGDMLYLPMEFIKGGNLRQLLDELIRQKKWMPLNEALRLVQQLCQIVEYAHQKGILHRDIKPANLMLKPEPNDGLPFRVVLTDLGLAKLAESLGLTQEGTSIGTPAYMSPEQALGKPTDPRSDVYSLGILLYELVVGQLPFAIRTLSDAVHYHTEVQPPAPRSINPSVPEAVERVVLKALEKDPDKRYGSAQQLASALADILTSSTDVIEQPDAGRVSLVTEYHQSIAAPPKPQAVRAKTVFENASVQPRGKSVFGDQSVAPSPETRIQVTDKNKNTKTVNLPAGTVIIGRDPSNHIVLEDEKASRKHAQIAWDGLEYHVMDLKSSNGTFLENVRLLPGVAQILKPGQNLRIGSTWIRILEGAPREPSVAPVSVPAGGSLSASSSAGLVAVSVTPENLSVEPGGSVTATVSLLNQSPNVDHFVLLLTGIPNTWIASLPPSVHLMPGEQKETVITLLVPRSPESRAGQYPLTLKVNSQRDPTQFVTVKLSLRVAPYSQYKAELQPLRLRAGRPGHLTIFNQGNSPENFTVQFKDAANELTFRPPQLQVQVAAGSSATTEYSAQPRQRKFLGGETNHAFNAQVSPPKGEPQTLQAEIRSRGLIPIWVPPLLIMLCVGLLGAAVWFSGQRQSASQATQSADHATQTATLLVSDLDFDGLTYEQEIAYQCDPDNKDTDGDGLPDSEEKIWGTDCTVRDSDHDGLLDGAEVNNEDPNKRTHPMNSDTDGDGLQDNVDAAPGTLPTFTPSATPPTPSLTPLPPTATPPPTMTPAPTVVVQKILYVSPRNGNSEIFVINSDGNERQRLTTNDTDDFGPDWSPNGNQIAFSSGGILTMNANGNKVQRLTSNALDQHPDWSPDGNRIVFASGNIFVINADGTNLTPLTSASTGVFYQDPVWSPNGNQIAFSSNVNGGGFNIYVMNADGNNVIQLTTNITGAGSPAWSPDGNRIAFQALNAGSFAIFVMNANGSGLTMISGGNGDNRHPAWSPDSQQIVFASNRDGNFELYVMNADGTNQRRLLEHGADDQEPDWSQ